MRSCERKPTEVSQEKFSKIHPLSMGRKRWHKCITADEALCWLRWVDIVIQCWLCLLVLLECWQITLLKFMSRWWFQIFVLFTPNLGDMIPNLTNIFFKMGWFNHQRVTSLVWYLQFHTDVSENSGTPKSSILIGFSIINHPCWGTPNFWKHPYCFNCVSTPLGMSSSKGAMSARSKHLKARRGGEDGIVTGGTSKQFDVYTPEN